MKSNADRAVSGPFVSEGVLYAPEVEQADRDLLARYPWTCKPITADSAAPVTRLFPGSDGWLAFGLVLVGLGVVAYVVLGGFASLATWGETPQWDGTGLPLWAALTLGGTGGLAVLGSALLRTPVANRAEARAAERAQALHGQYILPEIDLDDQARASLRRARAAAQRIVDAQARDEGIFDALDASVQISETVWRLGIELVDLTQTRRRIAEVVKELPEDDQTAAANPYRKSVDNAQHALGERIRRIEAAADSLGEVETLTKKLKVAQNLKQADPRIELASNRAIRDPIETASLDAILKDIAAARQIVASKFGHISEPAAEGP